MRRSKSTSIWCLKFKKQTNFELIREAWQKRRRRLKNRCLIKKEPPKLLKKNSNKLKLKNLRNLKQKSSHMPTRNRQESQVLHTAQVFQRCSKMNSALTAQLFRVRIQTMDRAKPLILQITRQILEAAFRLRSKPIYLSLSISSIICKEVQTDSHSLETFSRCVWLDRRPMLEAACSLVLSDMSAMMRRRVKMPNPQLHRETKYRT